MTTIYNNNRYHSTSKSSCEYACNDKCHMESVRTLIHQEEVIHIMFTNL